MQESMPFYDTPEEALKAAVSALGGAKKIGQILFPEKSMDIAARYLSDCINEARPEKLSAAHIIYIFRLAKQAGFHAAFDWFANECEYESKPITSAEQEDRQIAIIEETTKALTNALKVLDSIKAKQ